MGYLCNVYMGYRSKNVTPIPRIFFVRGRRPRDPRSRRYIARQDPIYIIYILFWGLPPTFYLFEKGWLQFTSAFSTVRLYLRYLSCYNWGRIICLYLPYYINSPTYYLFVNGWLQFASALSTVRLHLRYLSCYNCGRTICLYLPCYINLNKFLFTLKI